MISITQDGKKRPGKEREPAFLSARNGRVLFGKDEGPPLQQKPLPTMGQCASPRKDAT